MEANVLCPKRCFDLVFWSARSLKRLPPVFPSILRQIARLRLRRFDVWAIFSAPVLALANEIRRESLQKQRKTALR
jgi:hypothetical protein